MNSHRPCIGLLSSPMVLTLALVAAFSARKCHAQDKPRWPGPKAPVAVEVKADPATGAAASRQGEPGFRAIYRIDRDGENVALLATAPGMLIHTDPALSPDGRFVAFGAVSAPPIMGNARLFVMELDGPAKGALRDFGHGISPSWSPDGTQIAYAANPGNHEGAQVGVWMMNADGSNRRWLAEAFFPKWSPDGKQFVFELEQTGDGGKVKSYLCSLSAEAAGAPDLLESEKVGNINRAAAFSADSDWLVFSSER